MCGFVHGTKRRERVKRHGHIGAAQFIERVKRCVTKLGNVGQHGHFHRLGKFLVHGKLGHGFGKDRIGSGFDAGAGPINGRLQAFNRERIGSGHDQKVGVGLGIYGSLDPVDHFFRADNGFARPVAAAFCAHLIFNMHAACAKLDQRFGSAGNVKRRGPKARVDIDQKWHITNIGDAANIG